MSQIQITEEEADRFEAVLIYVLERFERRQKEREIQKVLSTAKTMMDHIRELERAKLSLGVQ